jgi:hypothetical protein
MRRRILHDMPSPGDGSAARVRALVARLEFMARRGNDDQAATAFARELDAEEYAARIDRDAGQMLEPSSPSPTKDDRSAPDG